MTCSVSKILMIFAQLADSDVGICLPNKGHMIPNPTPIAGVSNDVIVHLHAETAIKPGTV
jgi:hypothetical protein